MGRRSGLEGCCPPGDSWPAQQAPEAGRQAHPDHVLRTLVRTLQTAEA